MSINLLSEILGLRKPILIPPEVEEKFSDEKLCRRCGLCCYGSVPYQGKLAIILDLPCKYLIQEGEKKNTCAIYPARHQIAKWCQGVNPKSVARGLFPNDCPYVQGIQGYQGKVLIPYQENAQFYNFLQKTFRHQPCPEYLKPSDWQKFLSLLRLAPVSQNQELAKK